MNQVQTRRILLAAMDACLYFLSFCASVLLWNLSGTFKVPMFTASTLGFLSLSILIHFSCFYLGGIYRILWSLAGVADALQMIVLECISCVILLVINALLFSFPNAIVVLASALTILAAISARFIWRMLISGRLSFKPHKPSSKHVMVVGAGEAGAFVIGQYLARAQYHSRSIILIDDDINKQSLRIHNVPVQGRSEDIPPLAEKYGVQEILIAIPSLRGEAYTKLIALCNSTKCKVRVLRTADDTMDMAPTLSHDLSALRLRELNASDFLSREEVLLDVRRIQEYIDGRVVLVTGGGGSIGSELCRQILRYEPKVLIIFDNYENNAYELLVEMRRMHGRSRDIRVIIGSVKDKRRLEEVFAEQRPEVVFHAAAHKHVSLMEHSPGEAIKNNILGTKNLLDVCAAYDVERFVLLSTDKAVNPTSVMGATKRVCEMLMQSCARKTSMKCMAVRFGNVLGSHGSVIPLFESQIKAGGPVTITDPTITRYFMTIPEAAQLVLQAGSMAESGCIYILDMGEPVRILDLAEKMIRFFGYTPYEDIDVLFTGLRTGEKLYEELLTEEEKSHLIKTAHSKIFVSPPLMVDDDILMRHVEALSTAVETGGVDYRLLLKEMVDTYQPFVPLSKNGDV